MHVTPVAIRLAYGLQTMGYGRVVSTRATQRECGRAAIAESIARRWLSGAVWPDDPERFAAHTAVLATSFVTGARQ